MTFRRNRTLPAVSAQRYVRDCSGCADPGLLTDCVQQAIEERAGVITKRHRDFPGENVIGPETGRNRHHFFQAQAEQRRTREENESERDLRDNKSMAKALRGATNRASA